MSTSYDTSFVYVDAFWQKDDGKPSPWIRVLIRDLDDRITKPSKNRNCFCTVQRFREAVTDIESQDIEIHYCGFYFDFDARMDKNTTEESVVTSVKIDVQRLVEFFKNLGVEETYIKVWFSGRKGFHVIVHPEALRILPSRHNTYIMKVGAEYLAKRLNLKSLDLSVYSKRRQWRLPNSIHHSSGLFKVELYHSELNKEASEILAIAKAPRYDELYPETEFQGIKPEEKAVEFWESLTKDYDCQEDLKKLKPNKLIVKTDDMPVCVANVLQTGPKMPGTRNKATMALASYFKDTGMSQDACEKILLEWVDRMPDEGGKKKRERVANTSAVINTVYRGTRYHFACQFIRSLSSGASPDNKVPCVGEPNCPTIQNNPDNQRPAEIPRVPLSRASEAVYMGKKVQVPVMITGKADSPYTYPKKVKVRCKPNEESPMCQSCPIKDKGGEAEVDFDIQDQTLIDLVNCTTFRQSAAIKRHAGIPGKCYSCAIEITEYGNLEEVRLQPNIITTGVIDSRPGEDSVTADPVEEGNYCTRLAYFIGHNIQINRKYDITTTVLGHPRDQKVCHLFDTAKPSQDDIDKFRMTPEIYSMLRAFQPIEEQTVEDKFNEIHDDLENNIHMIWGRREVAIALDLVYHSVIGFFFQTQFEKKGWIELLIIGDSGNGKTKLVERVMNHYQLGEITGVEGGKRTGLIWANHNIGGRFMLVWGKIPQNDRRLIVLDEFSGMPDEEVATMTRLRTEGIAESQGINPAMTSARTRMIFLSNARNGRPLNGYNYGVEAVNALFKEHQDVRRLDLAVCVQSGDVSLETINKKHQPDLSTHAFTTALCKNLVLWAWSRDPRQIKIQQAAEDLILKYAITIGNKYRCDIVLVEPSDERLKLARMACAVAARMFSTDERGENLIVKAEHVEFAVKFLQKCYDHKAMEYNVYAKIKQEQMYMDKKERSELKKFWKQLRNNGHLRTVLLGGTYFRKGELQDQTGYTKDEISDLISKLSAKHLIHATTGGYRKAPMFTAFLKEFDFIDSTDPPF